MSWLPPLRRLPRAYTERAVRHGVEGFLVDAPALSGAQPELRDALREGLQSVAMLAADLLDEDLRLSRALEPSEPRSGPPVELLAASDNLGMKAVNSVADTTRSLREAIDFPTFVQSLITGVFQAISRSSMEQMESIASLLKNVSLSANEFSMANVADADAVQWLLSACPFLAAETASDGRPRVTMREGQDLFSHIGAMAKALGVSEEQLGALEEDQLDVTLLPMAKRKIGRGKQQNLATLVMMGLTRIIVDRGQLHASMDMRVDARSAADSTERTRVDSRTDASAAAAGVGVGWGASAAVNTTVGVVKDTKDASSEEIAAQAGLRSSVDLVFRTEPIALDVMASADTQRKILENTHVPQTKWSEGSILTDSARAGFDELGAVPDHAPSLVQAPDIASLPSAPAVAESAGGDVADSYGHGGSTHEPLPWRRA